ncbi:MAG TPA: trypsin-like peptidase domain-containing protein, partial [Planctomycetota bacterium]|nr:trypsin-like peptidase domain-containing protein [Planctomycetota bacterium]
PSAARVTPTVALVQRIAPAVVGVGPAGGELLPARLARESEAREPRSDLGSGVLIDPDGYIVTSVSALPPGTGGIRVRLADASSHPATLLGLDLDGGLALLKIAPRGGGPYPIARLGTSSDLMVGEPVIVLGNPTGREPSVSSGILSSLGRGARASAPGGDGAAGEDRILVDAPCEAGFRGGPVLNNDGQVIGILSATQGGARGLSGAIPVDRVRQSLASRLFCPRLLGEVVPGFEFAGGRELVVTALQSGGAAERAGLRLGDQLLEVGGAPVTWEFDLNKALLAGRPGGAVPLLVGRGEDCVALALVPERGESPIVQVWCRVGVQVVDHNRYKGVRVSRVDPTGPAAELGLVSGDLIDGLDEELLDTTDEVFRSVQRRPRGAAVVVHVWRGREAWSGPLILR